MIDIDLPRYSGPKPMSIIKVGQARPGRAGDSGRAGETTAWAGDSEQREDAFGLFAQCSGRIALLRATAG
jgi:hypothetical protein